MKKFIETLDNKMQLKIQEISDTGISGFEYFSSCYKIVKKTLKQMNDFIICYEFPDEQEEIIFFKETKPRLQSRLLFYIEFIQIELHKPLAIDKKELIKYYKRISRHYLMLIDWNLGFMQYIRSGLTTNDNMLFVRSASRDEVFYTDINYQEEKSTTPASCELAKIMAFEKVIENLAKRIAQLKSDNGTQSSCPHDNLVWTGTKVALIELAYALQSSDSINMGNADIKQVVSALEYIFNIDVGNFYRVFQNIRIRQSGRTIFLDELIAKLTAKMDDSDAKDIDT